MRDHCWSAPSRLTRRSLPANSVVLALAVGTLGDLNFKQGRYDEAEAQYQRGLAIVRAASRDDSRSSQPIWQHRHDVGDYAKGGTLVEQSLTTEEKLFEWTIRQ